VTRRAPKTSNTTHFQTLIDMVMLLDLTDSTCLLFDQIYKISYGTEKVVQFAKVSDKMGQVLYVTKHGRAI
jgi:hypothetical protein